MGGRSGGSSRLSDGLDGHPKGLGEVFQRDPRNQFIGGLAKIHGLLLYIF